MARHPNDPRDYVGLVPSETSFGVRLASPCLMWRLRQPDYGDLTLVRLTRTSSPI